MIRLITEIASSRGFFANNTFTFHIMIRLITNTAPRAIAPVNLFTFHIMIRLITRAHKGFMH